jgi:hypothetical protein
LMPRAVRIERYGRKTRPPAGAAIRHGNLLSASPDSGPPNRTVTFRAFPRCFDR